MRIESDDFKHGERIPGRFTCDGENINPHLRFLDIPSGAESLVLVCEDPDATGGQTWIHWAVWNIPTLTKELAPGRLPDEARLGLTSFGKIGYGGPCPPPGAVAHRYFFKLYAVSSEIHLQSGSSVEALMEKIGDIIINEARLVGLYGRE